MAWVVRLAAMFAVLFVMLASGASVMGCNVTSYSEWTPAGDDESPLLTDSTAESTSDFEDFSEDGIAYAFAVRFDAGLLCEVSVPSDVASGLGPENGVRRHGERPPELA